MSAFSWKLRQVYYKSESMIDGKYLVAYTSFSFIVVQIMIVYKKFLMF